MIASLHHLRIFLAVAEHGSVTRAASMTHITQSAVTQAIAKLTANTKTPLFHRHQKGLTLTKAGDILAARVTRVFDLIDPALSDIAPRLKRSVTVAQLKALIALYETENFTLAAERLGLAQPTVHKAVSQFEADANRTLFLRTPKGMLATRPAQVLAQKARLAFVELEQAEADLADADGHEVGLIVIGAMPLSRSHILPRAIAEFRHQRPQLLLRVLEGTYDSLVEGLRRGEIDLLIGALRAPDLVEDLTQEALFEDELAFVARPDHPLLSKNSITIDDLGQHPWVVALPGTPTRKHFDDLFMQAGKPAPISIVESGSIILMRELLKISPHLGCVSKRQVLPEIESGQLAYVPFALGETERMIGLTYRSHWLPTAAQHDFLTHLRATAAPGVFLA